MPNVLITGANSGFGLLTARKFAEAGYTVHAGFRSKDRAGDLEALARENPSVRPVKLDVTDQPLIDAAVAEAKTQRPIDVLVNNAGFELACPVDGLSDELVMRQFDTNVFGIIRMVRAVAPQMRERGRGAVVNLSSIVGWITMPYTSAYAASKRAVESFTEGLWYELAPFGIRVAMVEPGVFPTNFNANVVTAPDFDESSPHWPHRVRYRDGMRAMMDSSQADPQEVADLVYEAATTDTPKLRYAAGADARAFIPAYRNMEFEAMLSRAGLTDWNRATAAAAEQGAAA